MKNSIVVAICIVVAVVLNFFMIKSYKKEINRISDNYSNVVRSKDSLNSVVNLTIKELKKELTDSDREILKEAKIKPKQVMEVTNIYNYDIDTTISVVSTIPVYKNDTTWKFLDKKDCFTIGGYLTLKNDLPGLVIDQRKYEDNTKYFLYWERKYKFLFIHFGRKQNYIKAVNDCAETTLVQKIEVLK